MSEAEIELAPFEHGHKQAIRECRFKTVNLAHTTAIVYDSDELRIRATGLAFTAYRPAPQADPHRWDYEARSADERVIDFVAALI